jgi:hypothetical protein
MTMDHETKAEIDKLRKRYRDLGKSIDGFVSAMSRGTTATDDVLSAELTRARMELASIARRLQGFESHGE